MKYILTALGFWLTAIPAFSQTQPGTPKSPLTGLTIGRLYGKIVEASTNAPVPYASVAVLKKMPGGADSLVGGALTKENGEFSVPNLPAGSLTVQVKYLGYKNLLKTVRITLPNDLEQDLGDLAILPDETLLRTVEVTADKAMTNLSLEKRVFNVDKNSTSAGGTAEDVMKSIPSVSVDVDGNVKLRDRGTTIYVDGKPTLLTLSQIPADQIESVEVISNPSAKYEASTSGGILNIVLKKNTKPGYNGLIAAGIGWQNRYNAMLNLNVNQGKFNVSGFYNLNASKNPSTGYAYRTNRNPDGSVAGYFNQNTDVIFQNTFQMGRVAVD
ncbi:MAG: carboxypeptidase regulatory-like domain-containing protein [Saprospiraceae bacterium]